MAPEVENAPTTEPAEKTGAAPDSVRRVVMFAFGLSGVASLIYEVAWTRQLSMVFTSTVYALSIMLAAFMAGLALGGWLGGKWADERRLGRFQLPAPGAPAGLLTDLAAVEFGIGAMGLVSILLVHVLPPIQYSLLQRFDMPPAAFFGLQMALAFIVMLAPTTLMGATLPIASKMVVRSYGSLGSSLGLLYAVNTVGSVFGSLIGGFVLVPLVGVRAAVIFAAAANLAVAAVLTAAAKRPIGKTLAASAVLLTALVVATVALPEPAFPLSFGVSGRYMAYAEYKAELESTRVLYSNENAYSRVVVLETGYGRKYLVNGSLTEGSDAVTDRATTSLLAFMPYAYSENPKSAFIVGLGTGITSQAMLSLPLESVTTVEINPAVEEAARIFIGDELFSDKRWNLEIDDARGYLQKSDEKYDIITSEPSWPLASAVAPLFTKEFYELARTRLTTDGVFCQWAPQYLLPKRDFETLYRTFDSVFPGAEVWWLTEAGEPTGDLLLVGATSQDVPTEEQVKSKLAPLMTESGLSSVDVSIAPYEKVVKAAISDPTVPMNTDDRPVLESHIPWELARNLSGGVDAR